MPFYAVARGKQTGVYLTWGECQEQIVGFKGPAFKKFNTQEEAETFVQERSSNLIDKRKSSQKKTKEAVDSSAIPDVSSSNQTTETQEFSDKEWNLSPSLLEMKQEMKVLQRQLSELRTRFELYINGALHPLESSSKAAKRRHSVEEGDSSEPKKTKLQDGSIDKSKFTVNSDGFLVVFTDGSCGFNGRHGAKAGIGVYFGEDHPMNVSEPVKGRATNNTAEIQAAMIALELTKSAGFDKVILNTDSQFMINCATSWMPNWKKRGWKKADGGEVINKEDLIELDKASEGLLVKWNHIKGHNGVTGNEAADKLAREGAKRYTKE